MCFFFCSLCKVKAGQADIPNTIEVQQTSPVQYQAAPQQIQPQYQQIVINYPQNQVLVKHLNFSFLIFLQFTHLKISVRIFQQK